MKIICFKKIIIILVLFTNLTNVFTVANCFTINSPEEIVRLQQFLKNNSSNLSEENKSKLNAIEEKLENFEAITQEELDFIRECEKYIIRQKLGDVVFEEYTKLIKKRAGSAEFTPEERFRLLQIERTLVK